MNEPDRSQSDPPNLFTKDDSTNMSFVATCHIFYFITSGQRLRPQTDRPPSLLHPPPYRLSTTNTLHFLQRPRNKNLVKSAIIFFTFTADLCYRKQNG